MMIRSRILCAVALAAGLSSGLLQAASKQRPQGTEAGADDVKVVLLREQTQPLDRRAELHPVLNRQPDLAPARWQSGYVDMAGSWRSYTSLADPNTLEVLEQYREKRQALDGTVHSQLQLAHWCHERGLRDQERAQLLAALEKATPADRLAIYERLGYRPFGSQWLSPGEVAELASLGKQAETSLRHWGPILERVANQIDGNPHQRRIAQKMLNDIRDPAAIPAIESALMNLSETGARSAIESIERIEAYQASQSLARAALFANSNAVRAAAVNALKSRRMDEYVPSVIDLLSTDAQPGMQVFCIDRGPAFYTSLLVRERADQVDVQARTVIHPGVATIHLHHYIRANKTVVVSGDASPQDVALNLARSNLDQAYRQDRELRQVNEAIEQLNHRAVDVLAAVSGEAPTAKPQDWWAWWDRESDRQLIRAKTVVRVDEFEASPTPMQTVYMTRGSCFVAGTPVWTETGPVPIEKLQIGDRVLAQNVETGELTYKPVLQATVRPPKELVRLTAGGEQIVCTGGHRFWASGQGWMKARDLTPAHLVRTATATVRVEEISRADVDKTHNLVVADFHSYFVGKQAFLVQDLPLPRSTNCVVPGLQPEW